MEKKIRKNIDLNKNTIRRLKILADKDNRKLKPYMEHILSVYAELNQLNLKS